MDKKRVNEFGFGGEEEDQGTVSTVTEQTEEEKKTKWVTNQNSMIACNQKRRLVKRLLFLF